MKRLFSILISSLFFATSAWAISVKNINSYAVNLSLPNGGNVNANREVTVSFYTMAKTSKWWVYMDIDRDGLYEDDGEIIAYNENAQITTNNVTTTVVCTIPDTVPVGEYNWAVKVQGTEDHSWEAPHVARNYENDDNRYLFVKALGVAVDCNYNSPFFGYSYVTESYTTNLTGYKTPSDKTYRQASTEGVYMFKYHMGTVWNKNDAGNLVNNGAYTGNLTSSITNNSTSPTNLKGTTSKWGRDDENYYYKEHSPFRICTGVDDEGYVYVSENVPSADRAQKVFRMDPNNPKASFRAILTNDHLGGLDIVKRVQSMTVARTSDGKKVLYAIFSGVDDRSGDGHFGNGILTYPKLCAFDITDLEDVKCIKGPINLYNFTAPNRPEDIQKIVNPFNSIVAGKNDDLWIFQHRTPSTTDVTAGTLHFNKNWECDFVLRTLETRGNTRGVGALSHDGTILAIPTNASSGSENIRFYTITYDENDKSTVKSLTKLYDLPAYEEVDGKHKLSTLPEKLVDKVDGKTQQHLIDGMAFDVANNLYFISGSGLGPTSARSRLYVYARPKTDNSHLTPARSSLMIRVSEGLTWHPYPDGYDVTNADLQAMFNTDRANWSGSLTDFMTNNSSPWKWLGDYIAAVTNANAKLPEEMDTNEELWGSYDKNTPPQDGFKKYFNSYYGVSRSNMTIANVATFWDNNTNYFEKYSKHILLDENSEYKWLGDYIQSVASEQGLSLTTDKTADNHNAWRWSTHAFFNAKAGENQAKAVDFSSAGKPSAWGAAYLKSLGTYIALQTDADWQKQIDDFFAQKELFTEKGKPGQWHDSWWKANFPGAMVGSVPLPTVKRIGYVQNGWYYGGAEGYEEADRETSNVVTKSGHIWARWLQDCLNEGYVTINNTNTTEFSVGERDAKQVNRNLELINTIANEEYDLQLDRKIQGGMYNTMCLPFAINGKNEFANIKYADGSDEPFANVDDFSLVKYTGTRVTDEAIVLTFQELGNDETLPANTPFLLKPNSDIIKLMQYGTAKTTVVVTHDPVQVVEGDEDDGEGGAVVVQTPAEYALTVDDKRISYTGVLAPVNVSQNSVLLVANNRLAVSSSSGEMLGMRGFFTPLALPIQQPMAIQITTKDGATTYLDAVNMTTETKAATKVLYNGQIYILRGDEVYTITGNRVK